MWDNGKKKIFLIITVLVIHSEERDTLFSTITSERL